MSNFHILYLDSDNFIASQVKMRLEWKGYHVISAGSEQELLTNIAQQLLPYDLLIVDFLTPSPNAFSLLEDLKLQNFSIPTIIVNTEKNARLLAEALHLGCMDYVVKDPLIQNFTEQLSFSIFQSIAKLQLNRTQLKNRKSSLNKSLKNSKTSKADLSETNTYASTSTWEYSLSKRAVQWFPIPGSAKKTLSYKKFLSRIHADDIELVKTKHNTCLYAHIPVNYSFRYLSGNKTTTYHAFIKPDVDKKGVVNRLFGRLQIDSPQHLADQNLQLKLSFFEHTKDAIFITDAQKRIISINNAFTTISGLSEREALTKKSDILNTEQFDTHFFNNIGKTLKNKHFWQGEVSIRHLNGHSIPAWQSIYILKDKAGKIYQTISILRDISQQKEVEESIKFQANYDPLTHLPNRTLFKDRLANAMKQCQRNNKKLALMLLDLNKFKWINDTFGHHVGDCMLQETTKKLLSAVRSTDTVARLGGDEFCIIVPELEKTTDAELIARKIFTSFEEAIVVDHQEVFISGSIGIAIFPDDGSNITTLQKNADSAMYIAKNRDDNSFYYYTQALQQETEKRLKLITDMQSAIIKQEFTLYYQPTIDLQNNKVIGAEALLRWNHPEDGYLPLSDFIPIAEESGLIREIGNWVINEVASNMHRWSTLGLPPIHISINQSATQYNQSDCYIEWLNILNGKQVSPHNITFEVPEKIFIEKQNSHLESIKKLKQEGIQISLDSFGTGYSSLSYLKKFPFDGIKIDRSYIHSMVDDSTDAILVETMIILANKLGIKIVATGVENQEQLDLLGLLDQKCRYAQGNYFSRPLPLEDFEQFMKIQNKLGTYMK
jgi:diguanylate cyclase (GGDEF)-like protein/PAS domain S-box-containing protein